VQLARKEKFQRGTTLEHWRPERCLRKPRLEVANWISVWCSGGSNAPSSDGNAPAASNNPGQDCPTLSASERVTSVHQLVTNPKGARLYIDTAPPTFGPARLETATEPGTALHS